MAARGSPVFSISLSMNAPKTPPHLPQAMGHEQPITFSQWWLFWQIPKGLFWHLRASASLRLARGG